MTDQELLAGLRFGSHDAFDAIFREHYPRLVAIGEGVLRERALAEEVAQDVLLELWRRRQTLQVEGSLRAYLFRAARNRALNRVRHEKVRVAGEPHLAGESSTAPVAHVHMMEDEIDAALKEAVGSLPPRCREVFELSRTQGLKYAEIAEVLGISQKTVEAQMGKALRVLRERLAPWLPG